MEDHFSDVFGAAQAPAADPDGPTANQGNGEPPAKRAREMSQADIERLVDAAASARAVQLTAAGARTAVNALRAAAERNQTLRLAHPDEPLRFVDSELALDDAVKSLAALGAAPELLGAAAAAGLGDVVGELLAHDNVDVVLSALTTLSELSEAEAEAAEEAEEEEDAAAAPLLAALVQAEVVPEALSRLLQERLDEARAEEARGVELALGVLERALDLRPELAGDAERLAPLVAWLTARLARKPVDANGVAASELLSIVLSTGGEPAQAAFEQRHDGVEQLLRGVARYRRREPDSAEELEFAQNLFACLCSALLVPASRTRFRRLEGLELMQRCMREQKFARASALKVVDFALSRCPPSCAHWVRIGGLQQLFPLFMGRRGSKSRLKQSAAARRELEEHAVSVVASLAAQLPEAAAVGDEAFRVAAKFAEAGFEKADRLAELFLAYLDRVGQCNDAQQQLQPPPPPEELYLQRLDAGLFTLQRLALVMGRAAAENAAVRDRLARQLDQEGVELAMAGGILAEYAAGQSREGEGEGADQDDEPEVDPARAQAWATALQQ